ncbi:hypothetical protein MRB53_008172 [Persea americana]|uniref:Uncharacterized protein n=1 Tax=Persea americana TaxID=3435 RepID=A0ACC2MM68_PERAE|nr:hypothetical protein MRB53_008172 [Persea americana]
MKVLVRLLGRRGPDGCFGRSVELTGDDLYVFLHWPTLRMRSSDVDNWSKLACIPLEPTLIPDNGPCRSLAIGIRQPRLR